MTQQVQFIGTTPTELVKLLCDSIRHELDRLDRIVQETEGNPRDEIMTRKETAELFSVSLVTIHDWSNSGILKSYKVGNRTYFKRSECMKVLNESNPESL